MTTPRPRAEGLLAAPPDRDSAPLGAQGAEVLRIAGCPAASGRSSPMTTSRCACAAADVVALLGHNGAGKTTLVSQLVGLLRPHAGQIRVGGADAVADPPPPAAGWRCRRRPTHPSTGSPRAPPSRSPPACGAPRGGRAAPPPRPSRRSSTSCSGWTVGRCRTGRGSRAACGAWPPSRWRSPPPPLCWCSTSRPTTWTPRGSLLWQAVRHRAMPGPGVLLVTHNVAEAERIVDELVILDHGRVVATGTPAELRGTRGGDLRWARGAAGSPLGAVRGLGAPRCDSAQPARTHRRAHDLRAGRLRSSGLGTGSAGGARDRGLLPLPRHPRGRVSRPHRARPCEAPIIRRPLMSDRELPPP